MSTSSTPSTTDTTKAFQYKKSFFDIANKWIESIATAYPLCASTQTVKFKFQMDSTDPEKSEYWIRRWQHYLKDGDDIIKRKDFPAFKALNIPILDLLDIESKLPDFSEKDTTLFWKYMLLLHECSKKYCELCPLSPSPSESGKQ